MKVVEGSQEVMRVGTLRMLRVVIFAGEGIILRKETQERERGSG
jgi:hypothetical protein